MLTVLGGGLPEEPYKIERSLRFNSADSAYLSRTPIAAGNRKTWTWSGWVKRSNLGTAQTIFSARSDDNNRTAVLFDASDKLQFLNITASTTNLNLVTTQVFRDPSAWYHIVVQANTGDATAASRARLYVNGQLITALATATYPNQNTDTFVSSNILHGIGRLELATPSSYLNGYLTEVHFIDGLALGPEEFGETDPVTGVWRPKQYEKEAVSVQYLVIAGGGGGGLISGGGGGGAGGYRTDTGFSASLGTTYTVEIGAGGAGEAITGAGDNGVDSVFATITSTGGGGGGGTNQNGGSGGSGGGAAGQASTKGNGNTPSTAPSQGNNGGNAYQVSGNRCGGGGGGASAVGGNGVSLQAGNGGAGTSSSITGSAVSYAGGGGGGITATGAQINDKGTGGTGGGGNGGAADGNTLKVAATAGTSNTGGGGGGGSQAAAGDSGGNGGSGVVILRFPSTYNITVGAGLTYSQSTVGSDKVVQFTAGTGTVSFS